MIATGQKKMGEGSIDKKERREERQRRLAKDLPPNSPFPIMFFLMMSFFLIAQPVFSKSSLLTTTDTSCVLSMEYLSRQHRPSASFW